MTEGKAGAGWGLGVWNGANANPTIKSKEMQM